MQKLKCLREFVTFIDKDMTVNLKFFALRTRTHVSQRLTGQAFTLMFNTVYFICIFTLLYLFVLLLVVI